MKKTNKKNKYDKYDLSNPINQPVPEAAPLPKLKKIAIVGTACQGKSTLIKDMIIRWPTLSSPNKSYRDVIKEKGLVINQNGNQESQKIILDVLIDQIMTDYGSNKTVFDRCPLDNLIYTLWLNAKYPDRMPDEAVKKTIDLVRESMRFLDAIFFIPLTEVHKVSLVEDSLRDTSPEYIAEIDNLFKAIIHTKDLGVDKFFPLENCPPIIEIFGDRETRIKMLELYIDDNCEFVGTDDSVLNDIALKAKSNDTVQVNQLMPTNE